jgi:hypothetical protein
MRLGDRGQTCKQRSRISPHGAGFFFATTTRLELLLPTPHPLPSPVFSRSLYLRESSETMLLLP